MRVKRKRLGLGRLPPFYHGESYRIRPYRNAEPTMESDIEIIAEVNLVKLNPSEDQKEHFSYKLLTMRSERNLQDKHNQSLPAQIR